MKFDSYIKFPDIIPTMLSDSDELSFIISLSFSSVIFITLTSLFSVNPISPLFNQRGFVTLSLIIALLVST